MPSTVPAFAVRRVEGAPVVSVRVWLPGGARAEAIPGLCYATGQLLSEGTRRRTWREIADQVEARGMVLSTTGSFESHGLGVDALADDWQEALALAAEIVAEPSFPADRTAWATRQILAELDSLADQPEVRTAWAFLEQLYHPHRRALPLQGTADSLPTIEPADCAAFHARALAAGARVTVAGLIDEQAVAARVEALFPAVAEDAEEVSVAQAPVAPEGLAGRRIVRLPRVPDAEGEHEPHGHPAHCLPLAASGDGAAVGEPGHLEAAADDDAAGLAELAADAEPFAGQAHLYLGHLTIERRHDDFEALEAAAVVLGAGAGLTGRIPERIREREGLAYTATAQTAAGAGFDPGRLVVYVGTGADTVEAAEVAAREELARLVADGPSEGEVADAVAYLLGRDPFRRETARQWADLLAEARHYALPLDRPAWRRERLERLTRDEVAAAVARHVRPDELKVTIGLPAAEER
jgi:zinc protease